LKIGESRPWSYDINVLVVNGKEEDDDDDDDGSSSALVFWVVIPIIAISTVAALVGIAFCYRKGALISVDVQGGNSPMLSNYLCSVSTPVSTSHL
jgi:hypothetical protein